MMNSRQTKCNKKITICDNVPNNMKYIPIIILSLNVVLFTMFYCEILKYKGKMKLKHPVVNRCVKLNFVT